MGTWTLRVWRRSLPMAPRTASRRVSAPVARISRHCAGTRLPCKEALTETPRKEHQVCSRRAIILQAPMYRWIPFLFLQHSCGSKFGLPSESPYYNAGITGNHGTHGNYNVGNRCLLRRLWYWHPPKNPKRLAATGN